MNKPTPSSAELKEAILRLRLKKRVEAQAVAVSQERIPRAQRDEAIPLSWAQQRLWFFDQLDHAASVVYHIPAALRLKGVLERAALRATLDRIVARHEILRTRIVIDATGTPLQVIAPEDAGFALAERDLRGLPEQARQAEAASACAAEIAVPFDLSSGPLIRGQLLQLADDEYVLLITQHHMVSDGWSTGVLVREVSTLYAAFLAGRPDPLPPLSIQYADFAVWQRQWLQGETLQAQLDFWRGSLEGAPALLELPADRPRPAVQSHAGGTVPVVLSAELTAGLRALSQRHGTTLFMTLLAGWSILLSRLSGQNDVVVGTPVANRGRAEVEPLIGFFVNTLALRVRLDGEAGVADLLANVKAATLDAYGRQDLPFEQVVEAVRPVRDMSHNPVFQAMLALNNTPQEASLALPGLTLSGMDVEQATTHVDLSLSLTDSGGSVTGALEYASALFDRSTAERWAGHLNAVLAAMVADDSQPVNRLPLLAPAEQRLVLETFNDTRADFPRDGLIHAVFERQAAARPDAIALVCADRRLSFRELNEQANRIAHRLLALGVQPEDRVAICMERSLEMVVGMLGILKAGAAYVPVDPGYPHERIAYMVNDSAPAALLTVAPYRDRFDAALPCLALDEPVEAPGHNPDVALHARNLAYVIYTSGSTGTPKGVMVEHRNVLRLALGQHFIAVGEDDCVVHCANPAFDAATWEIWAGLLNGARLLVISPALLLEPEDFAAAMREERVTVLHLTIGLFNQYADALRDFFPTLSYLLFGGERADIGVVRRVLRHGAPRHLVHCYGPTETTTFATTFAAETLDDDAPALPIGQPIANTQVYILDSHLQPAPLGVAGELYIGGAGVARGYLNLAEQTAERFMADPFSAEPDARMYRTGDLGRWLPDGAIEYLGRNDSQVKIRGYRIELGEIEAKLAALDGVREAVVVAREDTPGDKRLAAYWIADDGDAPDVAALREALSFTLPEHMVPAAFVTLPAFPLTSNGKLDLRALPAPDLGAMAAQDYDEPAGDMELVLAALWCELLGVERAGRRDNFFALGGHSLLAVQLVSRIRQTLGVELALREVFAAPSLEKLAKRAEAAKRTRQPAIAPADRDAVLPLSWSQQRLWFLDQLDHAASAAYHMPAALRLTGALDRAALRATLDRIVARHEILRTRFAVDAAGAPYQAIAPSDCGFSLAERDLRGEPRATVDAIARAEAGAPFDLAAGPLIRGQLLRTADDEHVLLVTQHHIVSDGWSTSVLIREVSALYAAFRAGEPDPLPPLAIQYADYAVWQRQWLQGEALQAQLDFWRTRLDGAPALLELPADRPRPAVQQHAGGAVAIAFPAELTSAVRALSQRHGATLFMTLLAAWSVLLSRLSGQTDIVIGTPVANRGRAEIESLIGFFVNTLALRVQLDGDASVAALLASVKAGTLDAYAHQDLPFEQVVEAVKPVRSMGHSPVFQVMIDLDNTPRPEKIDLPGVTLSGVPQASATAQFDLALSLHDNGAELVGSISFASALFDAVTVERWAGHLTALLTAMAADDSQPVSRLDPLDTAGREQILERFCVAAPADFPLEKTYAQLFAERVREHPERVVAVCEGERLTYRELDERSSRVAHALREAGARTDTVVALFGERDLSLMTMMVGVLKAGAAFLPLEVNHPADRLRAIVRESRVELALVGNEGETPFASLVPEGRTVRILDAGRIRETGAAPAVAPGGAPGDLAYVISTSGTTGVPKGAMVEQRGMLNNIFGKIPAIGLHAGDRVAQTASAAFDISVWQFLGAPLVGGTVHIYRDAIAHDPARLAAAVQTDAITILEAVPSLLRSLLDHRDETVSLSTLRWVLPTGEALTAKLAQDWFARFPAIPLMNVYGPAECSDDVASHPLHEAPADGAGVPIGRPTANNLLYVVDRHMRLVPPGVSGEICVGGAGVGRGYLHRPDLTAERFMDDPFVRRAGARLYRTGDLGRWRADGTLDYIGRDDFQVKIRGYRIELGEIEARLAAIDGVREAVVIAREDMPGDKRLVAYLLHDDQNRFDAGAVRDRLRKVLPDYMVPAAFVALAAFPLTPNGKLDRRALPAPGGDALVRGEYAAPEGAVELAIAGIWQDLLAVERVGRNDNFFELGGHSLLAVQFNSRLRHALGVELALRDLFAAPTLKDLAERATAAAGGATPALAAADRGLPLPLSWAQQRLWFLDQLDPAASAVYHMPAALQLQGALDRSALRAALDRIVARHEVLRTRFTAGDAGGPYQAIAASDCGFALVERDVRGQAQAAVRDIVAAEAAAPFDLAAGPLIRGQLLQLADDEHILLLTQHHVISDGWSTGVLIRELSTLYAAFHAGGADPLPPLPVQYADYAVWQRQWLQGATQQAHLDFWRAHLEGAPALLELPTDRPRPAVQNHAGGMVPVSLSPELTAGLRALGQRHGATLFMTLLAGWSALLARLSGQAGVVVGTPVANRPRAELEPLIGFFANTLALHVRLDGDPTVAGLLASVKARTLDAYGHQDLPFEQVVEAVRPVRSLGHSPVFQAMLALDNTSRGARLALPDLSLSPIELERTTTQVDLSLSLTDSGGSISGALEYASALFDRASAERWAGHLEALLAAMVADDSQSVSRLPLMAPAEQRLVVEEFNATRADFPRDGLIHAEFERQAAARPDAIALVCEERRLSFRELNEQANRIAHRLLALGVQPEDRVAICMERSLGMVVGMLGILKAGAAYVPFDPGYPQERIAYMINDSAPAALLTVAAYRDRFDAALPCVRIDEPVEGGSHNPDVALNARNLAYVIYTSGSTGTPKGVMVEHRNVLRLALGQRFIAIGEDDCVVHCANPAFDAATWEIWAGLLNGARLLVISPALLLEPEPFAAAMREERVTVLHLTIGLFNQYVDALRDFFPTLSYLLFGGERADIGVVRRMLRHGAPRHLVHCYGPTETTTFATTFAAETLDDDAPTLPIGQPIANTQVYILDGHLQPAPLGVAGELYIGGAGVARGYLNLAEQTAERFVPDPFSAEEGARLYRTGDLGRWLPDGAIEYLGRNDFQVKIRGYRIELGEIEARLAAIDGVREAVVVAREDTPGDKRLVAYWIADDGDAPDAMALREALSAMLPEHMVPGAFVALPAFPLTPNGKLDLRALPAPDPQALAARHYEEPAGDTETVLAALWRDLLGAERVGRHDNFFALGGHSLLAVQLVSRVRQTLKVELALRDLFEAQTLAEMAARVAAARTSTAPALVVADRAVPAPLSWAQQRLWFLDQLDHAASAVYHMPAALRLQGALDVAALRATLDRIVARHEILRTVFVAGDGGAPRQMIAPADAGFSLRVRDLRGEAGDTVETVAAAEAAAPFDLSAGPLIRGQLLQVADDDHVLLITQHHVISDGWSTGVLIGEMATLYTAFHSGEPDPLPPLAIQYADYAVWQRQWLRGDTLNAQTAFWRAHLDGAPALLDLPTDRPRPAVQGHAGGAVPVTLSPELTARLRALSARHGATLFMTLLAGWSVLLARLSGQTDVVVGTPVANRQRAELEPLIGFFVNTLALRVRLDDDPGVAQLLERVKSGTLDAYSHQDLPFEQVVEAVKPVRSLGHSPVFQVMLALNNTPQDHGLALPGLALSQVETGRTATQFDLTLSLTESGESVTGRLEYASALFDHATVTRWADHLQVLLAAFAADDGRRVSALPLLSDAGRHALLRDFSGPAAPYASNRLIHQLFEENAARASEATALSFDGKQLSYGELNARANRLAHHLISLGVRPDERVAICMERGFELVVAVLGVLKAGAAYVPLDPVYPADRLAYMLDDSASAALLVADALQADLPRDDAMPVFVPDTAEGKALLALQPSTDPDAAELGLTPRHLAYVIYTSGSTGLPKATMLQHAGLCNLAAVQAELLRIGADSKVLQFASFSFDSFMFELVVSLCCGASLVTPPRTALQPGAPLTDTLNRHGVTHMAVPPALLPAMDSTAIAPMTIILAGEVCPPALARAWAQRHRVMNGYGPTETTVCATMFVCDTQPRHQVPIGRPIANTRIYILDGSLEPVPIGVEGEIYIAGPHLARGYLHRPALTAERFVTDPFGTGTDARMYRTGDLGRWTQDGDILYAGRNDAQVKIRGFRIETGEIEARLTAGAGIREAAVVALGEGAEKRLVAFLVPDAGHEPVPTALHALLSDALPDYMVPGAFVSVPALPLTPNGKLDRRALPAPDQSAFVQRAYEAPAGALETAIAAVWQELLGVERVGRHDNFFELGGHSLLVVTALSRLQERGVNADVRSVFTSPTPAGMAAALAGATRREAVVVPPNRIAPGCTTIDPDMLPLAALSRAEIDAIVAGVPGGAGNIQDIYALAPLQEGILFHHLLAGEGDAYLSRSVLAFDCRARLDGFLDALEQVIARHDILRTAVFWEDLSQPVQVVLRHAPMRRVTPAFDAGMPAMAQLLALTDPARHRLDLRQAPLMAAVYAPDPETGEWLLALNHHHMISDHVTLELIIDEIRLLQRNEANLLAPAVPFRQFVAQTLAVPQDEHAAYFKAQLADIEEPTAPFGILDVRHDGSRIDEAVCALDARQAQAIRDCARRNGYTPATLFHAAWARVLALCCDRDDVVFGTVVSGRLQGARDAERVLGMFINTLPLRVALAQDVRACVRDTHRRLTDLLEHEQAPLSLAQRASGVAAPLPLFTALLNYRHTRAPAENTGAQAERPGMRLIAAEERTNYPVSMAIDDLGAGFTLTAQCAAGIDAARMNAYLVTAVAGLVRALDEQPDSPMVALPVLPDAERTDVLDGFNDTAVPCPPDLLVHQLFERQAARRPDATALTFEQQSLTYAELNRRANRLAHHLLGLRLQPDDRIAVCLERGPDMVVALLGVLKAGAAYVPLDPSYPSDRLAYTLADSAPVAVLTQRALGGVLAEAYAGGHTVLLDAPLPDNLPEHDPDLRGAGLRPHHLAYVIYTSGSTGKPKGVMVAHHGVVNFLAAMGALTGIGESDALLAVTTIAFDIAALEIYLPLANGARTVVASRATASDPALLAQAIDGVTMMQATPATWRALIGNGWTGAPHCTALCGGEALSAELRNALTGRVRTLWNLYGPTETTIWSASRKVGAGAGDAGAPEPIGQPIANTRIYILDRHLQPVPPGAPGEIHIGGAGVARGYLNRPELTAERFLADPFSRDAGARMYKTGDLGRWLPGGTIEYLGRNDFQVKVRGYRIELGEIETRLASCAGVREAVVLAREDVPGDKRLVAYLLAHDDDQPDTAALRAALLAVLPDYMVPAAFVTLPEFPLTPNGKLDRAALPAPGQDALVRQAYEAPEGPAETAIAAVWQDLLGVAQVGRHDNFFELGGHSLLLIGMLTRLRKLEIEADVRTVFAHPTPAGMAGALAREAGGKSVAAPPNLIPAGCASITPAMLPLISLTQADIDRITHAVPGGAANIQDIYALAPLQQGILFHHRMTETGDAYLQRSIMAFDTRDRLDGFLQALQQVIDRHDILRTAVFWEGVSEAAQVVLRHAPLHVDTPVLDAGTPAMDQLRALTDPARHRVDLQRAPLLTASVAHDAAAGEWLLALRHHHMVSDHVTLELVIGEIQLILRGAQEQLAQPLPFRHFVAQARAVSEAEQEAYFSERLADIDEPTAPFGVLDVHADSAGTDEATLALDPGLAETIRQCARGMGVTPAALFHAAWARVLGACTGRDDVVFGTVLSGRLQGTEGADRVLGMFINTLPLRVSLSAGAPDTVRATQQGLADLLRYEQAPLSLAQRASGVAAPLPLFTSLLNYRHGGRPAAQDDSAGGWQGTRLLHSVERTNYPITMAVEDDGTDFAFTAQCAAGIDAPRLNACFLTAITAVVRAIVASDGAPLSTLPVVPDAERLALLDGFNDSRPHYPCDELLHRPFERQAALRPDATALVFDGACLSYGEVNRRANQVAHHLLSLGVRPDDRVAICMERGFELIIGLLGILKSGAAYVPLDPSYPLDRLAFMLSDCAPRALLTHGALPAGLDAQALAPAIATSLVSLDADGARIAAMPDTNPDPAAVGLAADNLAYVIYTSGSTGMPKGVMNEHGGIGNRLAWAMEEYGISPEDRTLQKTPVGFDVSVWEIFLTLHAGAQLIIARPGGHQDPHYLARTVEAERITTLHFVSSMLQAFLDVAEAGQCRSLVRIKCSGEALPYSLQQRTEACLPHVQLHNLYGPTEAAVHVTYWECRAGSHGGIVPIGRPVPNTRMYVLDAALQPVPLGAVGEIHIGGIGVARGYLNRPELSADRFIADPHGAEHGARMYKTGDLGRWLADGTIDYLGRNDSQVKIRGLRIELGEIEASLAACDGVRDAVVLVREDVPGVTRLVAYLVQEDGSALSAAELRARLATTLPEHMLPGAFVTVAAFPLTPNGKLDRRALPAPGEDAVANRIYEAPLGDVETALASAWRQLLGIEKIGRNDNFFELGGHSLLAMQLSTQLRQAMGVEVPLQTLFTRPVLSDMADEIVTLQLSLYSGEQLDLGDIGSQFDQMSESELLAFLAEEKS